MTRLEAFKGQWAVCNGLKLAYLDRLKFMAAASPRLGGWLSRSGIHSLRIKISERGRTLTLVIRPNGQDVTVIEELFLRRSYDVKTDGAINTILDLGGNIGVATLLLHSRFPAAKIAVVEPMPQNASVLKEMLRLNGITATVFEAAAGVDDGFLKLHVSDGGNSSSATWFDEGREINVKQMSVPTIMAALGWNSIDLLKVDIEGYEKILFSSNNDWLRRVNLIVGEAHGHVQYGIEELDKDLAPFGFRVTQTSKDPQWGMILFEARSPRAEAVSNSR